jgi:hypothetical protein
MKLDMDKLTEYDLRHAKAGDEVIIGNCYDPPRWHFCKTIVKSVSVKRGYVTMGDGKRYMKDGRKIGCGRRERHYGDSFFAYTQDNIKVVNKYIESKSKVSDILKLIDKIEKQGFKTLYDLPENKINILHKAMMEIFEVSEND